MSQVYGVNAVVDGVVMYLDAANHRSYPGSGTAWTDVSGNSNNSTLLNGAAFNSSDNGTMVFDGINDFASTGYAPALNDFTIVSWFKSTGTVNFSRIVDKNSTNGTWLGRFSTTNTWGGGVKESGFPFGRYITLASNEWHMIVSRRQGTTHTIYGDGITNSTSGTVTGDALSTNNFVIASTGTGEWFPGNIATVAVYNRALADSEILQTYNATKTRFGL